MFLNLMQEILIHFELVNRAAPAPEPRIVEK
jgi:hypothetical protein